MRVCSGPGCLRAVPDYIRLCDECKPVSIEQTDTGREHTSAYTPELDALRKSLRWQRLRSYVIQAQPLCARCKLRLSEICDHIVPAHVALRQARDAQVYLDKNAGYYLRSNLQGLCRPCHYLKTEEDKTHTGPWPNVTTIEQGSEHRVYTL